MCHPDSDREDTGTLVAVRMLRLGAGTFTGSEISSHTHHHQQQTVLKKSELLT